MEKFKDIILDPDTTLLHQQFIKIDNIDCKYEIWIWDGIEAESLIFCTNELESTEELYLKTLILKFLDKTDCNDVKFTYKSNKGYTFLNFNFKIN